MSTPQVVVFEDAEHLAEEMARRIAERISQLAEHKTPTLVLTGGTIAGEIYRKFDVDAAPWESVEYYWGDERYVPSGHADRNDREADESFLARCSVPESHIHRMPASGGTLSMSEAADDYAAQLPSEPFDLTLLGMGPDAHVASLFSGFTQLEETTRRVVEVFGSPKPPPERITLTFPVINHSSAVWLLVSGAGKAAAAAAALAKAHAAPAARVQGINETVWFLDRDAASEVR